MYTNQKVPWRYCWFLTCIACLFDMLLCFIKSQRDLLTDICKSVFVRSSCFNSDVQIRSCFLFLCFIIHACSQDGRIWICAETGLSFRPLHADVADLCFSKMFVFLYCYLISLHKQHRQLLVFLRFKQQLKSILDQTQQEDYSSCSDGCMHFVFSVTVVILIFVLHKFSRNRRILPLRHCALYYMIPHVQL